MKKLLLFTLFLFSISKINSQSSCENAQLITIGSTTIVPSFINETGTAPTLLCGLVNPPNTAATKGKWYQFVPETNGLIKVSAALPQNGTTDTRLIIYSGFCNNLVCVDSNDDFNGTNLSQVIFNVTAGSIYTIVFDNRYSQSGFAFTTTSVVNNDKVTFTKVLVPSIPNVENKCVVDMNGDYLDDVVSVINTTKIAINYQQPNQTFTTNTIVVNNTVVMPSWSIAAGDYDNNGFNDLVYGAYGGVTFLKSINSGTGYQTDRKPQSYFVQRTNFIDINNDGHLDAFACDDNSPNRKYLNNGSGVLTHSQGGLGSFPSGGNYASNWFDYDNDGDVDMFIAKCGQGGSDVGGNINEMYRNNDDGTFTNVAVAANLADPEQTWSSAIGDFDNNGWMDIVVGVNTLSDGNTNVKKNNGDGTFTSVTVGSGYDLIQDTGREFVAYDFDNDGFLDILGAGDRIMFGNGNLTFTRNTNPYNFPIFDRPIGDLNNDGFLDVQNGSYIMYNNGNSNKYLKLNLRGIASNRNGIGARVEIYGTWGKQIRDVQSGIGFQNMDSLNVFFGIGQATNIDKVIVRWPSGTVDEILNVTPNQSLLVTEGSSPSLATNSNIGVSEIGIYPNPAKDVLNIALKDIDFDIKIVQIFDLTGRLILETKNDFEIINVKNISKGTYVLVLTSTDKKQLSEKFIKQ